MKKIIISYKWKVMVVGAMGVLMSTMDMGMMRIALPPLGEVFGVGPNSIIWVQLIYLMVGTGSMLTMGKLADLYGRKRVFSLGLLIMSIGLTLCSLSQNFGQLIASRFVFSIGATMSIATINAIITTAFSTEERGKALGIIGAVVSIGLLSGPAVAGFLVDTLGWRSIFYLRLPISIIAMISAFFLLKADHPEKRQGRFDFVGAGLLLLAIPSLLFVLNRGQNIGWDSLLIIGLSIIGMISLGLFIITERKVEQPILDLRLFYSRFFSTVSGSHILLYMSTASVDFTMPFFLIKSLSMPTTEAGLLLVTIPGIRMVVSPLSGKLSDKLGTRLLCGVGFCMIIVGMLLLRRLTIGASIADIMTLFVIIGLGMGLFTIPNTSAIMGAVPSERLGTAAAMVGLLRQLGMSIGLAIAGSFFATSSLSHSTALLSQGIAAELVEKLSIAEGMQDTLLLALLFPVLGLIISILRGKEQQKSAA